MCTLCIQRFSVKLLHQGLSVVQLYCPTFTIFAFPVLFSPALFEVSDCPLKAIKGETKLNLVNQEWLEPVL